MADLTRGDIIKMINLSRLMEQVGLFLGPVNSNRYDSLPFRLELQNVNLSGVDLSGLDLRRADLTGANLIGANLTQASLYDVVGADFSGALGLDE
jgi:uncharacterized protein YjbI with pentapeptide repeats